MNTRVGWIDEELLAGQYHSLPPIQLPDVSIGPSHGFEESPPHGHLRDVELVLNNGNKTGARGGERRMERMRGVAWRPNEGVEGR